MDKNMKAVYDNSFCMDSDCIHYFEDMCMLCMVETGDSIYPYSGESRKSSECKSFAGGSYLVYVLTNEQLNEHIPKLEEK